MAGLFQRWPAGELHPEVPHSCSAGVQECRVAAGLQGHVVEQAVVITQSADGQFTAAEMSA